MLKSAETIRTLTRNASTLSEADIELTTDALLNLIETIDEAGVGEYDATFPVRTHVHV